MISLTKGDLKIIDVFLDGEMKSLYFHHNIDLNKSNLLDDVEGTLRDYDFREKYDLSNSDIEQLIKALKTDTIPETKLRTKYFKVKRALTNLSLNEMSLEEGDRFEINLPSKISDFAGHYQIQGNSGAGKTRFTCELLKRHWDNSTKGNKRKVLYVSNEAFTDKTLQMLRKKRYEKWFQPLDISDKSLEDYKEFEKKDIQSFYK